MHGKTPARDAIERALTVAAQRGQIKSWEQLPGYGPHAKWKVTLIPGAVGPQRTGDIEIRTYTEAHLICAVLASAYLGMQPQIDAWAEKVDRYRQIAGLEPGDDDTEVLSEADGEEGCEI